VAWFDVHREHSGNYVCIAMALGSEIYIMGIMLFIDWQDLV
jgi:hypothetical protein